jgi:DNA-binding transcriptional LysR family regulator
MHDAEAAMAGQAPPERLSVGTFASAGLALVPVALATFRNRHPSVRLSLLDIEPPGGYGLVTAGELDLLITHRYPGVALPPATGLQRTHLLTDPLRLVLPPDHRRAGARRIGLATLAGEDWISGGSGVPNRVALEQAAQRAGIEPRVAYETRDYAVTLALVAAGLGVALVPETALRATGPGSVVVGDLTQPVARDIFLVHRPRPRPAVHDMVGLLRPPVVT